MNTFSLLCISPSMQIQELVFKELSRQISDKLISSVDYLRESVVGTLRRCLEKLEDSVSGDVSQDTSQVLRNFHSPLLSF